MTIFFTITPETWRRLSLGERVAIETATALLWPLKADERMTVLIELLAAQIVKMVENEHQIDAIIDVLRMHMKLGLHHETQDQHRVR
jgi:hypothetical protein